MESFLKALAESLRNVGYSDATVSGNHLHIAGHDFYAYRSGKTEKARFTFLHRRLYRTSPLEPSILSVISAIGREQRYAEQRQSAKDNEELAESDIEFLPT